MFVGDTDSTWNVNGRLAVGGNPELGSDGVGWMAIGFGGTVNVVQDMLIFSNDSLRDPLRVALRGFRSSPAFQGLASSYAIGRVPACSDTAIDRSIRFVNSGNDAATVVGARMARGGAFSF